LITISFSGNISCFCLALHPATSASQVAGTTELHQRTFEVVTLTFAWTGLKPGSFYLHLLHTWNHRHVPPYPALSSLLTSGSIVWDQSVLCSLVITSNPPATDFIHSFPFCLLSNILALVWKWVASLRHHGVPVWSQCIWRTPALGPQVTSFVFVLKELSLFFLTVQADDHSE
jgi:hypothetical protein